jgi:hypothetical protein
VLQGGIQFADIHEILHAKWQGGEGDIFSQKNVFIALVTYKITTLP